MDAHSVQPQPTERTQTEPLRAAHTPRIPLRKTVQAVWDLIKRFWTREGLNALPRMVNWYDPKQLLQTAIEVFVSTLLGRHADRRSIEASNREARFFDFSSTQVGQRFMEEVRTLRRFEYDLKKVTDADTPKELWLDYVSDLGDGFNSTYAVAYLLAQAQLRVPGIEEPLKRGHILLFGGDEVYPTADRKEYTNRLVNPYRWAWKEPPANAPYMFALPGNHDWYDSLSSFMEFFSDYDSENFADVWCVPQNRSYFALKLPCGWWVLGIDLQLQSDLDYGQSKYFEKIIEQNLQPGDCLILCCAEPFWVYEQMDGKRKREDTKLEQLLAHLTKHGRFVIYLAGDLHHYFRAWGKADNQNNQEEKKLQITSGGGGAFLHPTHGAMAWSYGWKTDYGTKSYPSAWQSWWLGWRNLAFPFFNRWFGVITAALYFLLGWLLFLSSYGANNHFQKILDAFSQIAGVASLPEYFQSCGRIILQSPPLSVLLALTIAGFVFFTFTEHTARWFRWGAGVLHAGAHFCAALLLIPACYHLAPMIKAQLLNLGNYALTEAVQGGYVQALQMLSAWPRFIFTGGLLFIGGWLVGSWVMGLYLLLSLNVFGQHQTSAFSALKIQDWKNFLRLKLNLETGELTIYPLAIPRVPREWEFSNIVDATPTTLEAGRFGRWLRKFTRWWRRGFIPMKGQPHCVPAEGASIPVELIEGPIVITPVENHVDRVNVSFKGQTSRVKRSNQWLQRYHLERLPFRKERAKQPNDQ